MKHVYVKAFATPPTEVVGRWSRDERSQYDQMMSPLVEKLKAAGIWSDVEEGERDFLEASVGQVSSQQLIDASWIAESIVCLLWALDLIPEVPPYDQEADPDSINAVMTASIKEQIKKARFRSERETNKQREIAELWHWRSRTRKLQEDGGLSGVYQGMTIEQIIEVSANRCASEGRMPSPIGSDFPAFGKPYRDASSEEFSKLTSIAMERHKAFNWICGRSPSGKWTDTPTDT